MLKNMTLTLVSEDSLTQVKGRVWVKPYIRKERELNILNMVGPLKVRAFLLPLFELEMKNPLKHLTGEIIVLHWLQKGK